MIPTGNVTFLFTDIEGSTKLAQKHNDAYLSAMEKHHEILYKIIDSNNGFVFKIIGDAFCCAFGNAADAVKAAVDVQIKLNSIEWKDAVIKVRMGIHTGNSEWSGKDYMDYITLARTQRVVSVAYGAQILISNDSYELAKDKIPSEITFRDLGERRLKDVIQPIRLYQIVSSGLREDFPPLKTLDARPNNLPVQLTSFIGREEEMKRVKDLLKQTHLLTISGSGGAGKTRLSLQVAADVIDDFANGVWFVELASLFEPALLPQAIMKVFEQKEEPKRSLEDTLCDYLKEKEILIILDNCEHLIEHCAKLAEKLLSNSPKLKIIATSRESLRCAGEQTHRILSLEIPNIKEENSPEKLSQYEAVRLFIERALAVNENFRVNNDNAPALAQICYQLDGIPLAIELAAARIKVLSVEKIYERLNDRFNLLTGGKRTALPRQQTLRALIDWSYDLLSEQEKILWRRLSIFIGGWTLESAEEICVDEKIIRVKILDLLTALTEKSIINYNMERERYSILETIKQYGEDKLSESGEAEDILRKYLNYFMDLSETSVQKLNGSEVQIWLEKLESEHGNFQSAIICSLHGGETDKGARLAGALGTFWFIRCYYSTGRQLLEKILTNTRGITKSSLAKVFLVSGMLSNIQGDNEQAQKFFEESIKLNREMGNKKGIASSLNALGNVALNLGNNEQALKFYEESLAVRREMGDKVGIAVVLINLGNVANYLGNNEQAQKFYEESLALNRETGNKNQIAVCLSNLGNLASYYGNYEQAQKFDDESLALRREMGYKHGIAHSLFNLGSVAYHLGNYKEAKKFLEESLVIRRELGDKRGISLSLISLGYVDFDFGDYEEAQKFYEESLALNRELGEKGGIAFSLHGLGQVAHNLGNYEQAQKFYEESLALRREIGDKNGIAYSLYGLGNAALNLGNYEQAQKFYDESLSLRRETGDKQGIAYSLYGLGNAALNLGNYEQARILCEESLRLRIELGNKSRIAETLIGFAGILSAGNQLSRAVLLLGATENTLRSKGTVLQMTDLKLQDQIISKLHDKLSDEEFAKYFEKGKKLTIEQAAELALSSE